MANKFKVWGSSGSNFPTTAQFENESGQRGTGFQPNTVASSQFANAGLREATLFATAFMQMIEDAGIDTSAVDFTSTVASVQALLEKIVKPKTYRHKYTIETAKASDYLATTSFAFEFYDDNSTAYLNPSDTIADKLVALATILLNRMGSSYISAAFGGIYDSAINPNGTLYNVKVVHAYYDEYITMQNIIRVGAYGLDGKVDSALVATAPGQDVDLTFWAIVTDIHEFVEAI